jgi:sortase (surface protein transpeptidase)
VRARTWVPPRVRRARRRLRRIRRDALLLGVLVGLAATPWIATTGDGRGSRPDVIAATAAAGPAAPAPTVADAAADPAAPAAAPTGPAAATTSAAGAHPEGPTSSRSGSGDAAVVRRPRTGSDIVVPQFTQRSARLADVNRRPVSLRVGELGVTAPVVAVATDDAGELDVPDDAETVGWFAPGAVPGGSGSAVLAAHVDHGGRPGVFARLADLRRGDTVTVDMDDGSALRFSVRSSVRYERDALPTAELFGQHGAPVLTLVTCGGAFDHARGHYTHNTVVRAVPAT